MLAILMKRQREEAIFLRVDADVLAWFRSHDASEPGRSVEVATSDRRFAAQRMRIDVESWAEKETCFWTRRARRIART
jgi:hypothetical protein